MSPLAAGAVNWTVVVPLAGGAVNATVVAAVFPGDAKAGGMMSKDFMPLMLVSAAV